MGVTFLLVPEHDLTQLSIQATQSDVGVPVLIALEGTLRLSNALGQNVYLPEVLTGEPLEAFSCELGQVEPPAAAEGVAV